MLTVFGTCCQAVTRTTNSTTTSTTVTVGNIMSKQNERKYISIQVSMLSQVCK